MKYTNNNNRDFFIMSEFMEQLKEIAKQNKALAEQKIFFRNELNTYSSKLTKLQKSLIFFALSSIKQEDRENLTAFDLSQKPILIKVQDFLTVCNIDPKKQKNIYKDIETEILDLQKKPITYVDRHGAVHNISWFTKTSYYSKESVRNYNDDDLIKKDLNFLDGHSYYLIYFTSEIANHLVKLESNYMSYSFLISHNFDNKYSARIYELLQEHKNLVTIKIPMKDFVSRLALPKSYMVRSQLKHYVLEKVKEDINEKLPDLGFDHDFDKYNNVLLIKKEGMSDDYFFNEIKKINKISDSDTSSNSTTQSSTPSESSQPSTSSLVDNIKEKEQEDKGQGVTFKEIDEDSEE